MHRSGHDDPDSWASRRQPAAGAASGGSCPPGTRPFRLLADKAYSHPSTRRRLRERKIPHTIPERSDQIRRRKEKGSSGGRPPAFDPIVYRDRNTVERGYARLKQWRGIATRYDKYAITFGGGVLLAAIAINHRVHNLGDTP